MSEYTISHVYPTDKYTNKQVDTLLLAEGIRRDGNLDYTCAMYDDEMNVIATGSCFGNTLRCMAVSSAHQGEGLMNEIVSHLVQYQYERGNLHLFLYTKCNSARFFRDLGFHEIVRIENQIVFMENRHNGFENYLKSLQPPAAASFNSADEPISPASLSTAAIIMNANPFTLGHQYLVEKAAAENDLVHLFIVSEDASLVPFNVRKKLVMDGTAHLSNIQYHDCGTYMISNATFPSYFQKDEAAVIESHAMLDLTVFSKIAKTLGIQKRYVGEEPTSQVTGIYNQIMQKKLPENGIECIVIPRKEFAETAISASTVRQAIKNNDFESLKSLVPKTTLDYFLSTEARPTIEKIQNEKNVIHY